MPTSNIPISPNIPIPTPTISPSVGIDVAADAAVKFTTSALIGSGIQLATEIFKLVNTINSRKYCTKLIKLKENLFDELRKPMADQNDALIEKLQDDILIIQDLATAELKAYANSKS